MSRLSEALHARFGSNLENAQETIQKLLGEHYEGVWGFAQTVVLAMEAADEDSSGYLDKHEIAVMVIGLLVKRLGVHLPSWALNWIVEELVRRLKISGDFKIPVPSLPDGPVTTQP